MKVFFKNLWRQEEAATAVEYAVMLALILIAVIGAIGSVGAQTGGMWGDIDNELTTVGFGS
jgi:pilus assembly protein Flp/PilA